MSTLAPGTHLGPYTIENMLGAGGMGEVYLARDSRLGRTVAIKVLPETLSLNPERRDRFDREARAVASLNHPNICALFDIGSQGNTHFLVLEHLQGTTLAQRLAGGPMPVREAVLAASQLALALAAAHSQGVIHRDLKPANIMLTPNGVKVLDFGLAKFQAQGPAEDFAASPTLLSTGPQVILGTAAYMSPEQARGEPLDARTDVWSFGLVLYEMLTGQRFLAGDTLPTVYAALIQGTTDPSSLPGTVPTPLRALLGQLLERNPDRRLARMADAAARLESVLSDTRTPGTTQVPSDHPSIVVLPFSNVSADPDNEYFSDGLTEEVIADLSKVRSLRVISRTTAMRFKGAPQELRTVARELNVRYALEGSVRKAGNNFRITTQLIDTESDATIWSDKFGGALDDVFQVQEEVSRAIVRSLQVTLTPEEERQIALSPRSSGYAYDIYLRTRRDIEGFTRDGLDRARRELESALQVVGDDVLLLRALGMAHWQYVNAGISADPKNLDLAEQYARRLLELAPNSPHGTSLMGLVAITRGDVVGWLRNFEKAYAEDPTDPVHGTWLGLGWAFTGFPHRARPVLERQLAVDPHASYPLFAMGLLHYWEEEYDEGIAFCEKAQQLLPEHPGWRMVIAQGLISQGNSEGLRALMELVGDPEEHPLTRLTHLYNLAWLGDGEGFDRLDTPEYQEKLWGDLQYGYMQAQAYAVMSRTDDALRWLERSFVQGCCNYPYLSQRDPLLKSLRGDERFTELMKRVKVRWETLEAEVFAESTP